MQNLSHDHGDLVCTTDNDTIGTKLVELVDIGPNNDRRGPPALFVMKFLL